MKWKGNLAKSGEGDVGGVESPARKIVLRGAVRDRTMMKLLLRQRILKVVSRLVEE